MVKLSPLSVKTSLLNVHGDQGGGGGVLTYMSSIGMCRGKDPLFT